MTVIAILMALCSPVYHALAAATRVPSSLEINVVYIPHEPVRNSPRVPICSGG